MSGADEIYRATCLDILENGFYDTDLDVRPKWADGTPTHIVKKFGVVNRYNLKEEFLLMTLRRTYRKSAQRALSRNRVIHCLADCVLIAQCNYGKGGTWDGTIKNLQNGWSSVFCFGDDSPAIREFSQMGAALLTTQDLTNLPTPSNPQQNLFDQL